MSDAAELSGGMGGEPIPIHKPIVNKEGLQSLDWTIPEKLNKKWPRAVPFILKIVIRAVYVWNRLGSCICGTLFLVVLPLVPAFILVAKTHGISRETLIVTGIMQVFGYLNAENRSGGIAVFIGYALGFAVCAGLQDWTLPTFISIKTFSDVTGYIAATTWSNHLLDSFVFVCIAAMSVLNCTSVIKSYALSLDDHWFWEELKKLRHRKEAPKVIEEKKQ